MNSRERVLAMLRGEAVDRLPLMTITMQLAADRLGVKYREYETNARVLAEGQIQVAEELELDYVNTMSDPACEAADCGAAVIFHEDSPAAMDENRPLLIDKAKLWTMEIPEAARPGRMQNRLEALQLLRQRVGGEKLVEGWIEGPCAEAADLRGLTPLMLDFYDDPEFVHRLFEFSLEMELRFAREQVKAGAEQIGIGDAAASLIGPATYSEFVWPYEKRMVDGVHALGVPVRLHICGDTRGLLEGIGRLGCDMVDVDFPVPMAQARAKMGPSQVLLGNIDPVRVLRNQTPEAVYQAIGECHQEAGSRYIVGAGCEAPRDTPLENLQALARYAREHPAPAVSA